MENKMNYTYKCGICHTEHDSIKKRMECESACYAKYQEEEKKKLAAAKEAEKNARKIEVDKAFEHAYKLKNKFVEDYGTYTYTNTRTNNPFINIWDLL